ncbi:MAG: EF2563 family selenium-dependent molybdenum hydroxylase system protein [Spirochaetia bacterium]|nr:EF2563 family selenium-dependent molybdenum hydroxylase system protein [Spirochaetia bacterium]
MNKPLFQRAGELEAASSAFALVTILNTTGSASRNQGSMLVENSGAITSTIGGGALEAFAIEQAGRALKEGREDFSVSFTVDQEAKKGAGEVSLFIQVVENGEASPFFALAKEWEHKNIPFVFGFSLQKKSSRFLLSSTRQSVGFSDDALLDQARKSLEEGFDRRIEVSGSEHFLTLPVPLTNLLLIGGGHVNQAMASLAHSLGYGFQVVETRPEYATAELFAYAKDIVVAPSIAEGLQQVSINRFTYTVVASHTFDQDALEYLLATATPYIGILGSRLKARMLFERISVPAEHTSRIFCPIGLDIGTETPSEIALSVLAQVMKERSGSSGKALRDFARNLVVVRGGGDLATGVIMRLSNAGYPVVVLETERPTVIRTTVSFAQAMFGGATQVEGMLAKHCSDVDEAMGVMQRHIVPLLADPQGLSLEKLKPICIVDAILAKKNLGTTMGDAPLVIALGPGFRAGKDCHVVIETKRGHSLGRVIREGEAIANTGIPGIIAGFGRERVIHSPSEGIFTSDHKIGDLVTTGEVIAHVGETEVHASLTGMIRGLLNNGLQVPMGFKIADIDPRGLEADYTTVSDKAKAIGGSVLEVLDGFLAKR